MTKPMTSAEYAKWKNPAYNKLWGILDIITSLQTQSIDSYTFPTPVVVPVVVYTELISAPYLFTVESTVQQGNRRITKISWA